MPFRRRYKRPKVIRKRKPMRRFKRKIPIQRQLVAFPDNKIVKMRYCTPFAIDTGGGYAEHVLRANSIFDPDFTGGGHQPLGHDEWAQFYNNYTVLGSKITVRAINPLTTSGYALVWGVMVVSESSPSGTSYTTLIEQGKSKYRMMQGEPTGNVPQSLSMNFSTKKWFNVQDVKDNVATLGAAFGANPTNQGYYAVWYSAYDDAGNVPPMQFVATIDYIVQLHKPKELPAS